MAAAPSARAAVVAIATGAGDAAKTLCSISAGGSGLSAIGCNAVGGAVTGVVQAVGNTAVDVVSTVADAASDAIGYGALGAAVIGQALDVFA